MFSRAVLLLVALIVVKCGAKPFHDPIQAFRAKSFHEAIQAGKSSASVSSVAGKSTSLSSVAGKSLRSAIERSISVSRELAVSQFVFEQYYCTSSTAYSYRPVDTCITESDDSSGTTVTTSVKYTAASQTGTATTYTYNEYSDAACASSTSSAAETYSSTCGIQNSDTISSAVSIVSSISKPKIDGFQTEIFSDSKCATLIGYDIEPLNSCVQDDTSTSYKLASSSSTSVTYTSYSTADCSGLGIQTAVTISTTCTLISSGEGVGFYNKMGITSASTDASTTCFAGSESVQLEDGSAKLISEVSVGDVVLSADSQLHMKYSPVVAVPHRANNIEAAFSSIKVADERDIMLTPEHLIVAGPCGSSALSLVAAKSVAPGMCVVDAEGKQVEVVSNAVKMSKGLYTIVTGEEFIVVNGFVASPFAYNHFVANSFYGVYRAAVKAMPLLFQSQLFLAGFHAFAGLVMSV